MERYIWYKHLANQRNIMTTFAWVHVLRDSITKENSLDKAFAFIAANEGRALHPYLDTENKWHIGYGLLLSNDGIENLKKYEALAIEAFKTVLQIDLYEFIPVTALTKQTSKQFLLTKEQAQELFSFVLKKNNLKISKLLPCFDNLPANMQVALASLYYNAPGLIGPNLRRHINNFVKTGAISDYRECLIEISQRSNDNRACGLQNRRYYESAMFSDRRLDLLTLLHEEDWEKFCAFLAKSAGKSKKYKLFADSDSYSALRQEIIAGNIKNTDLPDIYAILNFVKTHVAI